MDNDSAYFVKNPKQIYGHLNQLWKKNCLLNAHFGENNDTFITTIIDIDVKNHRLILDYGPKEYLNKQLLQDDNTEFRAEFEGIKVAFGVDKIEKTRIKGQAFFVMPIPTSLFWMQRRKFYRIKIPLSHESHCEIIFYNQKEGSEQSRRFRLADISISGFSFINDDLTLSNDLIPTNEYENCTLQLHGSGQEKISFSIKNKFYLNPDKPEKGQRIGCALKKLSPACESRIQRYMQQIAREVKT